VAVSGALGSRVLEARECQILIRFIIMETETTAGKFLCRFITTATIKFILGTWLKKAKGALIPNKVFNYVSEG
jgi:hypothetical protein